MSALTNVFGSSGSSGSISPNSVQSTQIKNKVKEQITQELNVANVNELINVCSCCCNQILEDVANIYLWRWLQPDVTIIR